MMTTTSFFVETNGIQLPDGTIFGAGIEHKYEITHFENGMDAFVVYQIIGNDRVRITENIRYREMRDWVREQAKHYADNGMKFWVANHSDFSKATYKKIVDETY